MSDCFDHMCDAYERHWNGEWEEPRYYRSSYNYNPLYHHTKIPYKSFKEISDKCYKFVFQHESKLYSFELYVPKKLCKSFDFNKKTVFIHDSFAPKITSVMFDKYAHEKVQTIRNNKNIPWEEAKFYL